MEVLVPGSQWWGWNRVRHPLQWLSAHPIPQPQPRLLLLVPGPSLLPDLSLEPPSHSKTPGERQGRPEDSGSCHKAMGPSIVLVSEDHSRGRGSSIPSSPSSLMLITFFPHVNIKIILNVLIKVNVVSDHRIINSAWERLSGEMMFPDPHATIPSDLEYRVCMIFNH